MNDHLKPIFEIILPAIENSGIPYWVFGGIAIAGINGSFIRENQDVDIFVLKENYDVVLQTVTPLALNLNWEYKDCRIIKGRPKRDFFPIAKKRDIFSVVPVYDLGNIIEFRCPDWEDKRFYKNILCRQKVTIQSYEFFTPDPEVIRELFIHYLSYLVNKDKLEKKRRKYEQDAQVILCPSKQEEFFGIKQNKH